MGDPSARRKASNKLERANTFHRNDPLVLTLAQAVGLSPGEVDVLWIQAARD